MNLYSDYRTNIELENRSLEHLKNLRQESSQKVIMNAAAKLVANNQGSDNNTIMKDLVNNSINNNPTFKHMKKAFVKDNIAKKQSSKLDASAVKPPPKEVNNSSKSMNKKRKRTPQNLDNNNHKHNDNNNHKHNEKNYKAQGTRKQSKPYQSSILKKQKLNEKHMKKSVSFNSSNHAQTSKTSAKMNSTN
jgi:hypothetical protein